jgi:hypothetical protein
VGVGVEMELQPLKLSNDEVLLKWYGGKSYVLNSWIFGKMDVDGK